MKKYYKILDLPYDAPLADIKQSYRELVRIWHPDRYARDEHLQKRANAKLIELNEAYKMLCSISPKATDEENSLQSFAEPIDWSRPTQRSATQPDCTNPKQKASSSGKPGKSWYYATAASITLGLIFIVSIAPNQPSYSSIAFPPPEIETTTWLSANAIEESISNLSSSSLTLGQPDTLFHTSADSLGSSSR